MHSLACFLSVSEVLQWTQELCELLLGWDYWVKTTQETAKQLSDHSSKFILSFPYPRNCSDHADCCELMDLQRFLSTSVAGKKKKKSKKCSFMEISRFYYFLFFFTKISDKVCKWFLGSAQSCTMMQKAEMPIGEWKTKERVIAFWDLWWLRWSKLLTFKQSMRLNWVKRGTVNFRKRTVKNGLSICYNFYSSAAPNLK